MQGGEGASPNNDGCFFLPSLTLIGACSPQNRRHNPCAALCHSQLRASPIPQPGAEPGVREDGCRKGTAFFPSTPCNLRKQQRMGRFMIFLHFCAIIHPASLLINSLIWPYFFPPPSPFFHFFFSCL